VSRRPRRTLTAVTAALAIATAATAAAQAQAPAPPPVASAGVENGTLLLDSRFKVEVKFRTTLGVTQPAPPAGTGQQLWFFSDKNVEFLTRMLRGPGCFADPNFRFWTFCQPPINRFVIRLGPLDDKLKVGAEVPKVPGDGKVDAGAGGDAVKGGRNDETVDTGKGDDKANPGKGSDDVRLGRGDDKANTRDGEPDTINGGKGHDVAEVDKPDKVKNVEVVKRK
jgi:hypothetical protein